ncbi:hypothetical protein D3C75_1298090 [compost metagenome]
MGDSVVILAGSSGNRAVIVEQVNLVIAITRLNAIEASRLDNVRAVGANDFTFRARQGFNVLNAL